MSGGASEYVAAYYNKGNSLINGSSFANSEKESDEFSTVYYGTDINLDYIIGDATKETMGWNNDANFFINEELPFVFRGRDHSSNQNDAGIFTLGRIGGYGTTNGMRICLAI